MLALSPIAGAPIAAPYVPAGAAGLASVSADLACAYAIRAAVSADLAAAYAVRTQVAAELAAAYLVRAQVSAELACSYSISAAPGLTSVSASLDCAYIIRASVSRDLACSYQIQSDVEYVRAPAGAGYRGQLPTAPDTVKRVGVAVSAISLETARTAARVGEGDGLDGEVMVAAAGYTADAEHETQRCFIRQAWRATWRQFPAVLQLAHAAPLADVAAVNFYDQGGVLRTLDPRDYIVDADSEPACITPAPGCGWPATADRRGAVSVEYSAGYGVDEAAVPAPARLYVQARVQQQFSPVANAKPENFDRLLDSLRVYA